MNPKLKRALTICITAGLLSGAGTCASAAGINLYISQKSKPYIYQDINNVPKKYVAVVLGALVYDDTRPASALEDRLNTALKLYQQGKVKRILVTGDHGSRGYNEVKAMYTWLRKKNVPKKDIFLDHAGFRTFDSMQRAAKVFQVKDAVICTQQFHMARSVYLAHKAGIDAIGLVAKPHKYYTRKYMHLREFAARVAAFADIHILGTEAKHLGDAIPITGSSSKTYDF